MPCDVILSNAMAVTDMQSLSGIAPCCTTPLRLLHCTVGLCSIARVGLLDISLLPSAALLLHRMRDDSVGVRGVCRSSE
jgi:hypothetical protein